MEITEIDINFYDEIETIEDCTVITFEDKKTGDGFWKYHENRLGPVDGLGEGYDYGKYLITIYPKCTIEILKNTVTGKVSKGWKNVYGRESH